MAAAPTAVPRFPADGARDSTARSRRLHSFLVRGFDPYEDTIEFGRELIPRLRAGAAALDRAMAA